MRIKNKSIDPDEPRFSYIEPGTVFKSIHGGYYMRLDVAAHYKFNSVNIESGRIVGFNPNTKVIELLNATLITNEDE